VGELASVVGRLNEAEDYLVQATEFNDRARAKLFAACTNLSYGRMLARRNAPRDQERARTLLTRARTDAASDGYANVKRRADAALKLVL
jgi:hypothetical protein